METRPKRLFLTVLPQNMLVPSQQSLAFSAGEPASAFEGSTGVVAGTVLRRWNGNGGGRRWGPDVQSTSVAVSLQDVSGVHLGEIDSGGFLLEFCVAGGMETDSCGAQFVFPVAETESGGAQVEYPAAETGAGGVLWDAGPSRYDPKSGQREGAEVLPFLEMLHVFAVLAVLKQDDMTYWARLLVVQLAVQLVWDGVRRVCKCAWSALRRVL